MDLGREVAVHGAEGDLGTLGHGAHLDGVVTALGRERQRRVEDAPAAITLRRRALVRRDRHVRQANSRTSEHVSLHR
jgi:hypothetical protein